MHTGVQLGQALKTAMGLKKATQADVAKEFGITQPSVSEWLKFGRIGKQHITKLVAYFSDVVGPEHWGLPATWTAGVPAHSVAEPGATYSVPVQDIEFLSDFHELLPEEQDALRADVAAKAKRMRANNLRVLQRAGVKSIGEAHPATVLPPAPANVTQFTPPTEGGLVSGGLAALTGKKSQTPTKATKGRVR